MKLRQAKSRRHSAWSGRMFRPEGARGTLSQSQNRVRLVLCRSRLDRSRWHPMKLGECGGAIAMNSFLRVVPERGGDSADVFRLRHGIRSHDDSLLRGGGGAADDRTEL